MQVDSVGRTARSSSSTSRWKRWNSASAATPTDCRTGRFSAIAIATILRRATPAAGKSRRGAPSRRSTAARADAAHAGARRSTTPRPESAPAYQSLAREFDRVRGQEDSIAAVGKIAGELKGMREELRQQMTTGLAREFDALRKDIQRAYSSPLAAKNGPELGAEFERLSGAIQSLSEKSDDKNLKLLRLELEQVRGALDTLAREDTVRSVDRRWDDFDARFTKFEDRIDAQSRGRTPDPAIEALTARLEQINDAVHGLPESLSLRSLEEKVRTLAGAVDHFARQQDGSRQRPVRRHRGAPRRDFPGDRRIDASARRPRISTPSRSSGSRRASPRSPTRSKNWSKTARSAR